MRGPGRALVCVAAVSIAALCLLLYNRYVFRVVLNNSRMGMLAGLRHLVVLPSDFEGAQTVVAPAASSLALIDLAFTVPPVRTDLRFCLT